ncbi:MAG TPA: NADH-quinone oxidoreductase subunit NuoE [Firmicutes bacterium]|jgi:NADH-quinone oxidoreductase subunit E|nr:NADH-quinone oxidoreductase subunit NuoE [Bacillota bacterium]HAA34154.1 NADH-quinone oxidoreductase subunit NuoE [Bacillota bacterium]
MFSLSLLEGEREAIIKHVDEILKNYRNDRENLIPILQEAQERLGYLPGLAMEMISKEINVPAVDVFSLATFYNQFRLNPPGKHQIKVCMGTACYMVGGQIALESFERRLNIKEGETTPDRNFSLERVACVGCCSIAPVVVVDEVIEGKVTPTRVDGLMLSLETEIAREQKEAEATEKRQEKGV